MIIKSLSCPMKNILFYVAVVLLTALPAAARCLPPEKVATFTECINDSISNQLYHGGVSNERATREAVKFCYYAITR